MRITFETLNIHGIFYHQRVDGFTLIIYSFVWKIIPCNKHFAFLFICLLIRLSHHCEKSTIFLCIGDVVFFCIGDVVFLWLPSEVLFI